MIVIRKSSERGQYLGDWLKSYHTFSFSEYYDPKHMHFRQLRVINEDYIAPDSGFPSHDHHDMEIMTYMISGELQHRDSMGNSSVIKPGEIQFMRAGTQVTHSEFNPSNTNATHLLQIWIMPDTKGLVPSYHQRLYTKNDKLNKLCKIASKDGTNDSFKIAQNVNIYASVLDYNNTIKHSLKPSDGVWIQIVHGNLEINGITINTGDGASIENESELNIRSCKPGTEFLIFHFFQAI